MSVPGSIEKLIRTFADNLDDYKRGALNETEVRVQFIDPMFKALGWDVHNEQGYAANYPMWCMRTACASVVSSRPRIRGCPEFCVNGQSGGVFHPTQRRENDRFKIIYRTTG